MRVSLEKMQQKILLFFFLGSFFSFSQAQVDTLRTPDEAVDTDIEDAIGNTEVDEQVDFTYLIDYLQDLRQRPLDINTAPPEDLIQLPGMNVLLVSNLQQHISEFGPLSSIYELQSVKGFDQQLIAGILPYVKVGNDQGVLGNEQGKKGAGLGEIFSNLNGELTQRIVFIPEMQRGYTPPDTTFKSITGTMGDTIGTDTSLSTRYQGSPYQSYTRLRLRYNPHFSFGITGEKDRGEQWKWDPQNQQYGYDFLSFHVYFQNYGRLKKLAIGDYTLEIGQGLILSRGLGFGKGVAVISNVKRTARGIRPYSSVNENQYLRGAAATFGFGKVEVTAFGSRNHLDASVQERDSLTEAAELVGSLQTSGLHRTLSELANRKAIAETVFGGRVAYQSRTLKVGLTHYQQQFDSEINRRLTYYNQFDFRGDQNSLSSLDVDWVYQNFNFFGELARSKSGGIAGVAGMMSSLSPILDLAVLARSFDADFHSFKGFAFAERPTAIRNERGLYIGMQLKPHYKWQISSYFDQFFFPTPNFRIGYPSRGYEYLLQLNYKPNRESIVYVRFRSDNKERNPSDPLPGQQILAPHPTQRLQLRFHYQTSIDRIIGLKTRVEFSRFEDGPNEVHKGFLIFQDFSYKVGFKLKLTARYALFDVPDFDARIYAYENDVLGFFSIPAYNGVGSRVYLMLNYKPTRKIECWLRVAQRSFQNAAGVTVVGNNLELIQGDTQTEVKVQVRIKF